MQQKLTSEGKNISILIIENINTYFQKWVDQLSIVKRPVRANKYYVCFLGASGTLSRTVHVI